MKHKGCGFAPSSPGLLLVLGKCRGPATDGVREDAELPSSSCGGHRPRGSSHRWQRVLG